MTFLFFVALFIAALLTIGLYGVSRRLAEIEVRMIQDAQQAAGERRHHVNQLDRIEAALLKQDKPAKPAPTYRATPRYDFEAQQLAALEEFKEKA